MEKLMDKQKIKMRKDKEKNLVEEIQVVQMKNLKFQNHLPFPLALPHPRRQTLTASVGQRHAIMEVCACLVPH